MPDPYFKPEERRDEMEREMDEDEMEGLRGGWEEFVDGDQKPSIPTSRGPVEFSSSKKRRRTRSEEEAGSSKRKPNGFGLISYKGNGSTAYV